MTKTFYQYWNEKKVSYNTDMENMELRLNYALESLNDVEEETDRLTFNKRDDNLSKLGHHKYL